MASSLLTRVPMRCPGRSRSRTPARRATRKLDTMLERSARCKPGVRFEDIALGRLPRFRLLDAPHCLREFCKLPIKTHLLILGAGPCAELPDILRHFVKFNSSVGTVVVADACDFATQIPDVGGAAFKQLDLLSNKDELLALLANSSMFPRDERALIIASNVVTEHCPDLLCELIEDLPEQADLLLLEPIHSPSAFEEHFIEFERRLATLLWNGFLYKGGPRKSAYFFSRLELPDCIDCQMIGH
mmetsp:Transcript_27829/g.64246  ORF Transcript_27829/g.64246 Transcript_27829/m.64246 type:complete len:244 (-) Transcript_27829:26-757(-)